MTFDIIGQVQKQFPKIQVNGGVDFNGDGKIDEDEKLNDANKNDKIGDEADYYAFVGAHSKNIQTNLAYAAFEEIINDIVRGDKATADKAENNLVSLGAYALPMLKNMLNYAGYADPDPLMRVVRAAGNIGVEKNEDVAGTLKAFVEQGPYYFREERIVSGKPSDFLPVLVEAAKALGKMGEPAKGIFLPLLASPDEFIQKLAVIGLGETRSAKVVGPLLGLKRRSQDKNLQALIIQALGKIRSERVIRPLIESMKDDDLWIHAFYSLLAQGDSATTQLVNTLVDELIRLNNGSGEFLIRLIGEVAVEPLIDRLNQEVPDNTKRQILPMLVSIADPRVKNYLENLMVNPPEWLTPELQKSVEFAIE